MKLVVGLVARILCQLLRFWYLVLLRSNKKVPVFRVTQPYPNLLVKPRFFSSFLGKNIILGILKGISPLKMHKIIFKKIQIKNNLKNMCTYPPGPTLPKIFRPVT